MEDYNNIIPHKALGKIAPTAYAKFNSPDGTARRMKNIIFGQLVSSNYGSLHLPLELLLFF
tara:strand:+ start:284 stop:466 length:183 start_codon:yes stop_codon:yes gene_type:complete